MSPERRPGEDDLEGGRGLLEDAEDADSLVRAPVERFHRWMKVALALNATRRLWCTLNMKKEEDEKELISKIKTHAQVIRAAVPFQVAGQGLNGEGIAEVPLSPTPTSDLCISSEELVLQTGGAMGVTEKLKPDSEKGLSDDETDRKTAFGSNTCPRKKGTNFWIFVWELILLVAAAASLGFGIKTEGINQGWYDGGSIATVVVIFIVFTVPLLVHMTFGEAKKANPSRSLGTVNIVFGFEFGVIVAVDSRVTQLDTCWEESFRRITNDNYEKFLFLPPHTLVTLSGNYSRGVELKKYLETSFQYREVVNVNHVFNYTKGFLKDNKIKDKESRIQVLIVGFDKLHAAYICYQTGDGVNESSRHMTDKLTKCVGSGSRGAERALWKPKGRMTEEEGIKFVMEGLAGSTFADAATGGRFFIWVLSKKKNEMVKELSCVDLLLEIGWPFWKDTLLVFAKTSSNDAHCGGVRANFLSRDFLVRIEDIVDLGIVGRKKEWKAFYVDMYVVKDRDEFVIEKDACEKFLRICDPVREAVRSRHPRVRCGRVDFKTWNDDVMVTVLPMVVMLGSLDNLKLAQRTDFLDSV